MFWIWLSLLVVGSAVTVFGLFDGNAHALQIGLLIVIVAKMWLNEELEER